MTRHARQDCARTRKPAHFLNFLAFCWQMLKLTSVWLLATLGFRTPASCAYGERWTGSPARGRCWEHRLRLSAKKAQVMQRCGLRWSSWRASGRRTIRRGQSSGCWLGRKGSHQAVSPSRNLPAGPVASQHLGLPPTLSPSGTVRHEKLLSLPGRIRSVSGAGVAFYDGASGMRAALDCHSLLNTRD